MCSNNYLSNLSSGQICGASGGNGVEACVVKSSYNGCKRLNYVFDVPPDVALQVDNNIQTSSSSL